MNKHLFLFMGRPHSGKTGTVKYINEKYHANLIELGYSKENLWPSLEKDILYRYTAIGKPTIGFSSHGDVPNRIKQFLNLIKNCDIIICTARESKGALDKIVDFIDEHNFTVHLIYTIRYGNKDEGERIDRERTFKKFKEKALSIFPVKDL